MLTLLGAVVTAVIALFFFVGMFHFYKVEKEFPSEFFGKFVFFGAISLFLLTHL